MNAFLISYDLKTQYKNYDGLTNAIKGIGSWWHYLDSTWIVKTDLSVSLIQIRLFPHITKDDRLLIIRIEKPAGGWLTKDAWDWITTNVN